MPGWLANHRVWNCFSKTDSNIQSKLEKFLERRVASDKRFDIVVIASFSCLFVPQISMLTGIGKWLYNITVQPHVVFRVLPYIHHRCLTFFTEPNKSDHVTDDSGCTMCVTKWNGKNVSPSSYYRYATVKDIRVRKDDVFLAGYPKTGCHWMYEVLYMLKRNKAEPSKYGSFREGMFGTIPDVFLDSVPSPRVLNSHFLYDEHPTGIKEHRNKIVLTIRCPKDTVVSFYHHTKTLHSFYRYHGTFDDYFKMFMRGDVDYGNYFEYYSNWERVLKGDNENQIFLIEFEEMKENPVATIIELANFLESPISQDFAQEVAGATSFSNLKKLTGCPLFRKGIVGDWKNTLSTEQADMVNRAWMEKMAGFELPSGINRYSDS